MSGRNEWTPKLVPAFMWADKNSKQLIGVPIYLYTEFGLDPDRMPDDSVPSVRYHRPRSPKKVSRRESLSSAIPSPGSFPRSGKKVELTLPEGSLIIQTHKSTQRKIREISFVVPHHIDNNAIAFFLVHCCDKSKIPGRILVEKTEIDTEYVTIKQSPLLYANLQTRTMTPNDLGVKEWIRRRQT